jgi:myo-inositol 2-dehydrogenase / D-chiro-inositol 1-dehydrogenase
VREALHDPRPGKAHARRTRFRFALVGAGRMGQQHLRALARHPGLEVSDVAEPVVEVGRRLAGDGFRVHPSLTDLLSDTRPDALLIAAPTRLHEELVRLGVAAGVPMLCEKPAGLTAGEVGRSGRLAAEAGIPFQVAYWRRHVPALDALRDRIQAGALGEIQLVAALQWDERPPAPAFRAVSGGLFVDMGVHELDQIRWLTGREIAGVAGVAAEAGDPAAGGEPDSAHALLELSGGAAGIVSLGRYHPGGDLAAVEVFGTRGHERVVFLGPPHGEVTLRKALRRQAEAFLDSVRLGMPAGASVDDAVAALKWAERATKSARTDL